MQTSGWDQTSGGEGQRYRSHEADRQFRALSEGRHLGRPGRGPESGSSGVVLGADHTIASPGRRPDHGTQGRRPGACIGGG